MTPHVATPETRPNRLPRNVRIFGRAATAASSRRRAVAQFWTQPTV